MSKIPILGMDIYSINMTFSLTTEKVQILPKTCQDLPRIHYTTLLDLAKVIGLLSSTVQVVEPAKIQLMFL